MIQADIPSALDAQIKILTWFMGAGTLLVGALIAYLKVSTSNEIRQAKLEINQSIAEVTEKIQVSKETLSSEIQREFARREVVDARISELERRLGRVETWKEAIAASSGPLNLK